MSDLENFFGSESAESDPQAVEQMRERMKAAAGQIKKDQKQEQKQHKKEQDLAEIIKKYLQGQSNKDLMLLIVRCLEQNIPAIFVLAVISLIEVEFAQSHGLFPQITPEQIKQKSSLVAGSLEKLGIPNDSIQAPQQALFHVWLANLNQVAVEKGDGLASAMIDSSTQNLKVVLLQLCAFSIRGFLLASSGSSLENLDLRKIQHFAHFVLKSILGNIEKKKLTN